MTYNTINNIKSNEIRLLKNIYSAILPKFGLSIKEIYFVGSRVNNRARKTSDLDIIIVPKIRTWNNAQEYTNLMKNIMKITDKIRFRGNNIDLQISSSFNPGDSFGECYIQLKNGIIKKTCPRGEGHRKT